MRIFKNAWFERFCRKQDISDAALIDAVRRAEAGQIDADLGGGVIKQRIARRGQGKSGGCRTIVLFRKQHRAFLSTALPKRARQYRQRRKGSLQKGFNTCSEPVGETPDRTDRQGAVRGDYGK